MGTAQDDVLAYTFPPVVVKAAVGGLKITRRVILAGGAAEELTRLQPRESRGIGGQKREG